MKVLSVKGNKITLDLSEKEYETLLIYGMQLWIDQEAGPNKAKVVPYDGPKDKNNYKYSKEDEETANEFVQLAVNRAIKDAIGRAENKGGIR